MFAHFGDAVDAAGGERRKHLLQAAAFGFADGKFQRQLSIAMDDGLSFKPAEIFNVEDQGEPSGKFRIALHRGAAGRQV